MQAAAAGGLRMRGMQVRNHKNSAYIQRERQRSKQCKRPSTFFSNFFLPTISNYSTRLNSAQLTNSSQLSSSYQPSNSTLILVDSARPTHKTITYHIINQGEEGVAHNNYKAYTDLLLP